jgi:hypothetical protein
MQQLQLPRGLGDAREIMNRTDALMRERRFTNEAGETA